MLFAPTLGGSSALKRKWSRPLPVGRGDAYVNAPMSSTSSHRALVVFVLSLAALAIGCGRSPAMPRTPVKLVRVDDAKAVPCNDCEDDDDDDDEVTPRKPAPVQYFRMSDWQEPESARRAASQVTPSGEDGKPRYTEFPKLTLHKPIGETRVFGRYRWR